MLALIDVGSAHATATENTFNPNIYGATALGISLLSNIVATTLVGIKAWYVFSSILPMPSALNGGLTHQCEQDSSSINSEVPSKLG